MPTKLVYTVKANGNIEGLLKDEVLDTSSFGHRKIARITEILFDETKQQFYIKWLLGPWRGRKHTNTMSAVINLPEPGGVRNVQYFDNYAQAVSHEIECVNELRRQGISFVK